MPLTHIYYWEPKVGYRPITVEEADRLYDHGETVPADRTSRFVCGLCAQHVGFSKRRKGTGTRHFYHSKGEDDKECEDRSEAYFKVPVGYNCHPMPMRIKVHHGSYLLELGFFHAPSSDTGGPRCQRIRITGENSQEFVHSFERISSEGITYLNVGNIPSSVYRLAYDHPSPNLNRYWPSTTSGINPKGSFFECFSGKMLHAGGKAYPYRDYFFLQRHPMSPALNGITYTEIAQIRAGYVWHLYKIRVHDFSVSVAHFFLERSIFLTEKPVSFYPVWPPYVEDPYFLYHNDPTMYFYMQGGEAELNTYPASISPRFEGLNEGKLYRIHAASKEQLLSLGQSGAIGFSYLTKKELDMAAALPQVQIKSIDGKLMEQDVLNRLPKGNQITLQAPFDGKMIVLRNDHVQEIRHIAATQMLTVDGLSFGSEIQIFQSCDLIRTLRFEKTQQNTDYAELDWQLVNGLRSCKGTMMPVSHSNGASAKQLSHLPLCRQWLYQSIRQGEISADAIKLLASYQYMKMEDRK